MTKIILYVIAVLVLLFSFFGIEQYDNKRIIEKTNILVEYAYFEGQKDAIENKIKIKNIGDSTYIWSGSPWESGKKPKYNPNLSIEDNFILNKLR